MEGKLRKRREEEIQRASRVIFESESGQAAAPQINGTLRRFALRVPDCISTCTGIVIFGKRIRSLVFTTDVAIIRNVNADAVFAVYPYTPQPIITQALIMAAEIPIFTGVGGGLTQGKRVVNLATYAEMQGASGVVVNAPTSNRVVHDLHEAVDIPIIVTAVNADGAEERIRAGAAILNVAAGSQTPAVVAKLRGQFPDLPLIATGGQTDDSIRETIRAGANAVVWTPPTNAEMFHGVMEAYRAGKGHPD